MRSWEYKFINFEKALASLQDLRKVDLNRLSDLEIAGAIKTFEFVQERAWRSLQAFLLYQGFEEAKGGSRSTIDTAFREELIEEYKVYHDMIDKRNLSAHIYNRDVAQEIFREIVPNYLPALEQVYETLKAERA